MNDLGFPILSLLIWLPLVGAVAVFTLRGTETNVARNASWIALWTSLIVLALAVVLLAKFSPSVPGFQFTEALPWLPQLHVSYRLGVDGISVFFIILTALMTPIVVLASWRQTKRAREYMAAFLLLETMMIGMFAALDFLLFYIFFEAVLIPMFLIIGIWGGERRVFAALKFFLYTLVGSVLMLLALVYMWHNAGTTNIVTLLHTPIPVAAQPYLFLAFLAAFGVKAALWPLHTWLPDAYAQAPLPGTIMLAAILSKMGAYGFLRFVVPMLPQAATYFEPLMFTLGVVAMIYASYAALAQTDMKRMIAYSSIAHMGLIIVGIFAFNIEGIEGALFQMVSHSLVTAALFVCVGVLLARGVSLDLSKLGGLAQRMPVFAVLLVIFALANMGMPGTSGFIGEILVMVGAIKVNFWVALLSASGMVLAAAYMLVMVRRVLYDNRSQAIMALPGDINLREAAMFAPLVLLVLLLGIYPGLVTHLLDSSVQSMVQLHLAALQAAPNHASTHLAMVTK